MLGPVHEALNQAFELSAPVSVQPSLVFAIVRRSSFRLCLPFGQLCAFHCVNVFVAVSLCAFLRTSFVEVCPNLRSMFLALSEWEELGRHRCCICMLAFGTPYSFSCWWCCCCCLRALLRTAGPRNLRGPRHPKFRPCRCGLLQRLHPLKDQAKQKPERKTSNGIMPAPLQDLEIMS